MPHLPQASFSGGPISVSLCVLVMVTNQFEFFDVQVQVITVEITSIIILNLIM